MKKEIRANITWLINQLSQSYIYENWSTELKVSENKKKFNKFYEELKKNIDLTKITKEEAQELRFCKWSEEYPNLYLFPLWLVPIIPEGLEIMDICGEKYKYNSKTADNDIRFGCVAYGIEIKESNNDK